MAATVAMPASLSQSFAAAASGFHAVAPEPPPSEPLRLGYVTPGAVDTAQINELGRILDRYAGKTAPVFDFTNELGITYYLLNRVPGTRSFVPAIVQTKRAQQETISDLQTSRPPVVIYYDPTFGLPNYDGIPQSVRAYDVGQYILDHYQPFIDLQGQLLMLRNDLVSTAPPLPALPAGSSTSDLYFSAPACTLGDIPNFFADPSDLGTRPKEPAQVGLAPSKTTSWAVTGWAVDPTTGKAATQVLAVSDGVVVATAPTGGQRPDVVAALHDHAALRSGFSISIPGPWRPVTLYTLNADGSVSQLTPLAAPTGTVTESGATSIATTGGAAHSVVAGVAGDVDHVGTPPADVHRLTFAKGTTLARYGWLEVRSSRNLGSGSFTLTDDPTAPTGHNLSFSTLPRAGKKVYVKVGSCLQWHGYDASHGLYLVRSGSNHQVPVSISVVR